MYEEKSVTRRTALPLVVVVATFFLPMTDSCNHAVSPLTYVAEGGVGGALWVIPMFATALALAVAVLRSWRAKAKNALAFAAMGAFASTLPVLAVLFALDGGRVASAIYAAATVATALLMMRVYAKSGWQRLSALLDAYAVAAFPLALMIASLAKYAGGYAFVIAYVAFATQRALVALQSRAKPARHVRVAIPTRVANEAEELEAAAEEEESARVSALASSD